MPETDTEIELALATAGITTPGHVRYESGHHGDLWLDLDSLLVDAGRLRRLAAALADRARDCRAEIVCGPLTGGAFVAHTVAATLGAGFVYAERLVAATGGAQYRIPMPLRATLAGRRVLLVDDAVNAGSALAATLAEVDRSGGELVGFACLITLGTGAGAMARRYRVPAHTLVTLDRSIWTPETCPLCAQGMPLEDPLS